MLVTSHRCSAQHNLFFLAQSGKKRVLQSLEFLLFCEDFHPVTFVIHSTVGALHSVSPIRRHADTPTPRPISLRRRRPIITCLVFPGWIPRAGFALIALILAVSTGRLHAQQSAPTEAQASATAPAEDPIVKVGGNVPKPIELKLSDLSAMPRTDVRAKDREGKDITYSGVSLAELLRAAGLKLDPASMPSRDIVASYILVEAADGYRAVFALAEIDPAQTDRVILLADHKEGKPLSGNEGPFRIVVPGEKRPARWVRQVQTILVGRPE
jgi:Oxidoreductase molybdopterin binding domain